MLKSPGGLGKYDLQSLVIDFYHDSGEIELNLATEIAQYGAAANIDIWCSHMSHQTRESESLSEQELGDITYHSLNHACQPNDMGPEDIGKHVEFIED